MAKLVVTEFVSLDGVFEDPGGARAHRRAGGASASRQKTRCSTSSTSSWRATSSCWGA